MQKHGKFERPDIHAKIFLWEGAALYIGLLSDTTPHKHHAAQVCYGLDGEFEIVVDEKTTRTQYMAIQANCLHQLIGGKTRLAFALIDNESDLAGRIPTGMNLPDTQNDIANIPAPQNVSEARAYLGKLLAPMDLPAEISRETDPRIRRVLQRLEKPIEGQIGAKDLADLVNLFESRFLHLFSKHTGLPMRRYILWRRIISSIEVISGGGADLTSAAHMGGFSDSAHFSRTFRETFGLSPSQLFNSSRNIQVYT